jgi:hypothetical protein
MNPYVQHYPTLKHYESVHELISEFQKFDNYRRFQHEDKLGFTPPKDKFEKVRLKDNSFILVPTDTQFTLYRGQNKFYENCKPTIHRRELNELDLFINQLKINELYLLLNEYPIVKHIFKPEKFKVDYLGLAQHYGMMTDVLDFTSDLYIALFFATCTYDSSLDKYIPLMTEESQTGYLYVFPLYKAFVSDKSFEDFFSNKLQIIGLQPFFRPAAQKGFSLKLEKDESLKTICYTFNYNKNDSLFFYEKFNEGNSLWIKDILTEKAKLIIDSFAFSFDAFNLSIKSIGTKFKKGSYYHSLLNTNSFKLCKRENLPWVFSENEIEKIAEQWDSSGSNLFWESVVSRQMIVDNVKYAEISIEAFSLQVLLRTFLGEDNKSI